MNATEKIITINNCILLYHRARLWWWELAIREMGASHVDLPTALRHKWDIVQRIKELEKQNG